MTRRVYIAGPMSRESFCLCDRPSARSTLPIAADPIGAGVRDAVLDSVDRWDYNYPAFTRAAATLRDLGYAVCLYTDERRPLVLALCLRAGAGDPAVLAAVAEFLAAHEPDLLAASVALDVPPARLAVLPDVLRGT